MTRSPLFAPAALHEPVPGTLVLPGDAPSSTAPGPDPDRVLLVGSGPVAGVGVTSHEHALPGALARRLGGQSGRGAIVEAVGRAGARLDDVPRLLVDTRLERFDAVVVIAGMMEALDSISVRSWTRTLESVLTATHARQPRGAAVVLTGMPSPTSTECVTGWRGRRIDRRAASLNRSTRFTISAHPYGHYAPLAPSKHRHGQPTPASYALWADQIGAVLAPLLTRSANPP